MLYIFDWDGTLSDSTAKIVKCMKRAAADAALPELPDDTVKDIIGLGLPEAVKTLYPTVSGADQEKVRNGYRTHFVEADQVPSDFYPGVMDTLQRLMDKGYTLTVATGKSRRGLDRVLKAMGLESFFHGSRCADETSSKPDPHMLYELLEEFGVSAAEAVMVGDTEYDMAMAQNAGMHRIAVSYGAHHIDRLKKYEPVLCVDQFDSILDWNIAD